GRPPTAPLPGHRRHPDRTRAECALTTSRTCTEWATDHQRTHAGHAADTRPHPCRERGRPPAASVRGYAARPLGRTRARCIAGRQPYPRRVHRRPPMAVARSGEYRKPGA
ncbi:hypothetical protein ACFY2M_21800, partial [Streptomyces sp. NPDC001276]|uniref:hypothetical protein n=1 Tax=Streptomyces sp. NPDC001276 TaxID=3364555 RepID=UPI003678F7B4